MKLFSTIEALQQPYGDRLTLKQGKYYFRDALATRHSNNHLSPSQIQYAIFAYLPSWVNALMRVRNCIVSVFGFKVGKDSLRPESSELSVGDRAGFLTISEKFEDEIISYAEDKHMDFYLSVAIKNGNVIVSTLVNKKTLIGRIYVNAILPFHYVIARTVINNAIKAGRI